MHSSVVRPGLMKIEPVAHHTKVLGTGYRVLAGAPEAFLSRALCTPSGAPGPLKSVPDPKYPVPILWAVPYAPSVVHCGCCLAEGPSPW
jgi:hypothetical protein